MDNKDGFFNGGFAAIITLIIAIITIIANVFWGYTSSKEASPNEIVPGYFKNSDKELSLEDALKKMYDDLEDTKKENEDLKEQLNNIEGKNNIDSNNIESQESTASKNFMEVCTPFGEINKEYKDDETFPMAGKDRTNGFTVCSMGATVSADLEGKYNELSFDVGHAEIDVDRSDPKLSIYLDGEFYNSYIIKRNELPINVKINVKGKRGIKFEIKDGDHKTYIGFADMLIN